MNNIPRRKKLLEDLHFVLKSISGAPSATTRVVMEYLRKPPFLLLSSTYADAPVDWLETSLAHILRIDVPGLGKKDVDVQIHEGNLLEISGEYKQPQEKSDAAVEWHAFERPRGRFSRQFRLPDDIRPEDVRAHVDNGVLTVHVPKKQAAKPVSRRVPIVSSKL